jgi:hypothetical protein
VRSGGEGGERSVRCLVSRIECRVDLRREKGSRIGAAAVRAPGPCHEFHFRGLGGIFLAARGVSSGMLVGDVVYLLLTAAVSTGVWLRSPRPCAAGLWGIFGLPL